MTDFSHFSALRVEEREDRVHARMDRPGARNAIDQTMVDEFHELCAHLEREPKILIISGTQVESTREPGTFSGIFASGADIGQLRERRRDDALADRIAQQDPLAVRLSKRVFHLPREAHPHVDEIAQAILFESEAKFERMQAFLDRKKK